MLPFTKNHKRPKPMVGSPIVRSSQLAKMLSRKTGEPAYRCKWWIGQVGDIIVEALLRNGNPYCSVQLPGFGRFDMRPIGATTTPPPPGGGERYTVAARRRVVFSPSRRILRMVRQPLEELGYDPPPPDPRRKHADGGDSAGGQKAQTGPDEVRA